MQIVIDITEKDYEKIRETSFVENTEIMFKQSSEDRKGTMMLFRVIDAIKNGTPLPKGHGRLKDISKIEYRQGVFIDSEGVPLPIIHKIATIEMIRDWLPTIIEADKAESEE